MPAFDSGLIQHVESRGNPQQLAAGNQQASDRFLDEPIREFTGFPRTKNPPNSNPSKKKPVDSLSRDDRSVVEEGSYKPSPRCSIPTASIHLLDATNLIG
jgi:hypothetical protein